MSLWLRLATPFGYQAEKNREGLQGRHEPRIMVSKPPHIVSKPPHSQMSIKNDLELPLNVRIDIIEVINNIIY